MKLVVAPFLAVVLALPVAAAVVQDDDSSGDTSLGMFSRGASGSGTLFTEFGCPGAHRVQVTLDGSPWASLAGSDTIQLASGDVGYFDLNLDTSALDPGVYAGTATFTCIGCSEDSCGATSKTQTFSILVPAPNTFGTHPNDAQFGGLVGGNVVPIETLIPNVMNDIRQSTFGQTANGQSIIDTLDNHYLENGLSDVTIVPTVDRELANGRISTQVQSVDGESQGPGEASYVLNRGSGLFADTFADEEIYLGIDLSTAGIANARENPGEYFVFTYDGQLGVIGKSDLVHNLVHEGLHAYVGGEHNVGSRASIEEELDGFNAGNAACEALGLPLSTDKPNASGYGAQPNPNYQPLFSSPATTADDQQSGLQPSGVDGQEIVGIAGCSCPCGGSGQPACAHRDCVCVRGAASNADPFATGGQLNLGIPDGFTPSTGIPISHPFAGPMDANVLNFGPAASAGNRSGDMQVMIIVLVQTSLPAGRGPIAMHDSVGRILTIAKAAARSWRGARVSTAAFYEAETGRALLESMLEPVTQRKPKTDPPLRATITSLGVSTGVAFEIQMANRAAYPLDVSAAGIVVEPLKTKAGSELRKEFGKNLASAATQSFRADGYCLEYLRDPPRVGTLFRVAAPNVQEQFEPMRKILQAGQRLFDMGELMPDSDPMQYFHSIRQWALWAKERDFDVDSFGKEFLDRTKKNFAAARQPWTKQIEETVRGLVPNRWRDIERILDESGVLR